jgi:hypothetical protein
VPPSSAEVRGAIIQHDRANAADLPILRIDSLSELPAKIAELGTAGG